MIISLAVINKRAVAEIKSSSGSAHRSCGQRGPEAACGAGSRAWETVCKPFTSTGVKGSWRDHEELRLGTVRSMRGHWWRCSLCGDGNPRAEEAMKASWGVAMSEARRGHWWIRPQLEWGLQNTGDARTMRWAPRTAAEWGWPHLQDKLLRTAEPRRS